MESGPYLEQVRSRCRALNDARIWPIDSPSISPLEWLGNFAQEDQATAAALLECFVFFPEPQIESMWRTIIRKLISSNFGGVGISAHADARSWLSQVVFTPIEGERPSPVDSGNVMCRKIRQILGPEFDSQFHHAAQALDRFVNGAHLLLVDDFVGSGNQTVGTWDRLRSGSAPRSFAEASLLPTSGSAFSLSLVITSKAKSRLESIHGGPQPLFVHLLSDEDSIATTLGRLRHHPAIDPLGEITALLRDAVSRLSLPDYLRSGDQAVFGFHELALTIGFSHSIPDATLPALWAGGENWTALVPRT